MEEFLGKEKTYAAFMDLEKTCVTVDTKFAGVC